MMDRRSFCVRGAALAASVILLPLPKAKVKAPKVRGRDVILKFDGHEIRAVKASTLDWHVRLG